ncbi:dihydroorotase [Floccifex sp.]|uniref:dihydroorotase n=1 Tax=Floccifex sp. TaxID=2815810 RepID=UPI003F0BE449
MQVIRNGLVLIEDELKPCDILFDENEIIDIQEHIEGDYPEIDAKGCAVLPGFVDVHVHLREPGHTEKETIETGTKAAAHGGFTSIFCMPNVIPFPDNTETMKDYLHLIDEKAVVRTYPYACITKQEASKEVVDMKSLSQMGIHWFSDDGVGVSTREVMKQAMEQAKDCDAMIVAHTEDMAYRKPGASVHESEVTAQKGWLGIPSACESAQLIRDLGIVEEVGCKYHACHISASESVEALRQAKQKGLDVTGEVTVHHLLLEDKDVQGPNWKMNPPLRSHADRMALIEGLENGSLDFIANDHAPHTQEEKNKPMDKCPFGIVSLETCFSLLYTQFVVREKRWTLAQLVNYMSKKPAERFGLEKAGQIKKGYQPDFVIVDLNEEYVIDASQFESMGKNTPFNGWQVFGKIKQTIVKAQTVWKG